MEGSFDFPQINKEMNKKIFCEKCHKWHTITITDGEKFAICPNKRCGHLVFIQERK